MRLPRYPKLRRSVIVVLLLITSILLTLILVNNSVVCHSGLMLSSLFSLNKNETYAEKPVQDIEITGILSTQIVPNCVIVLRTVNGRLGNILFMFASAYGLAKTHGCLLHISEHISKDLHAIFQFTLTNGISKEHVNLLTNHDITSQHSDCQFDPKLMRPEAVKYFEITGYWQSFEYFSQYLDEIRTLFSFKQSVLKKISPFINSILPSTLDLYKNMSFRMLKEHIKLTSPVIWIGIHIRRGDNLNTLQRERGYTVPTVEFLDKAIAYFTRRYKNRTLFIIVSDDKPYCQKIFQNRRNVFITPNDFSPAADLATMSLCTDAIATCGSFSWWGAVLTGGIVLHDEQFPRKNTSLDVDCPRSSYYPPWFLLL